MGRRGAIVMGLTVAATLTATGSQAQLAAISSPYRVVAPGQLVHMDSMMSVDPDCRSRGRTTINLIQAPSGGQVGVKYGSDFPTFVAANPRSACNRVRVPATMLSYRASPGYTGPDSFMIEEVFPGGVAKRVRYALTIR